MSEALISAVDSHPVPFIRKRSETSTALYAESARFLEANSFEVRGGTGSQTSRGRMSPLDSGGGAVVVQIYEPGSFSVENSSSSAAWDLFAESASASVSLLESTHRTLVVGVEGKATALLKARCVLASIEAKNYERELLQALEGLEPPAERRLMPPTVRVQERVAPFSREPDPPLPDDVLALLQELD